MTENKENTRENGGRRRKKKKQNKFLKFLKVFIVVLLLSSLILGAIGGVMVFSILRDAPEIDPTQINSSLEHTSFIYDKDGNLLEKIESAEFRTFVPINEIPDNVKNAFIAIEDERFYDHHGVDPRGIISSFMDNIKAGSTVRGASTITQQLVKNVYLTRERSYDRKIKEAYLALQVERALHKDQILEAYLNRNFFGQNAYGVQEAAQTFFSKDVGDLTIAEAAVLAGVVKSHVQFQPYMRVRPDNYDSNIHHKVGEADVLGERYILVFNPNSVERQRLVLSKMLELNMISEKEYREALDQDIKNSLKPGSKKLNDITSYFSDYVKSQVIESLMYDLGYSREEAEETLFTGGIHIYSTIDVSIQKELENVYENFTEILVGNIGNIRGPALIDWSLDRSSNVVDKDGRIIYFKRDNLFNDNYELIIENGTYKISDNGDIIVQNRKLTPYPTHVEIGNYYTIDDRKNLVSYTVGSIIIPEDEFYLNENREIVISRAYLNKSENFYRIDDSGNLLISDSYFYRSNQGIVQPQSASVIMDYRTGHIVALVGGRDIDGSRVLNRATNSLRQPGSVIKPLSVYLPALDNGFTAASAIDDSPMYLNGSLWPRNWYTGFRGINSLRRSVEQSINVASVKVLDQIGHSTSMRYLAKLGIINSDNPSRDNFITAAENSSANDENPSALALGGMTRGLTPLEVTAAYGAIANNGVYTEPIAFTRVLDMDGSILIDNSPQTKTVVSPQIAFIMSDILRTTITDGFASRANIPNMAVAGKTGTTQYQADLWFIGYTPYYVSGVWIGNDSPRITLSQGSLQAAQLWQNIMSRVHRDLEPRTSFPRPEGIVSASVCTQSGLLAGPLCSHDSRGTIRTEIFAQGTVPRAYCDAHVEVRICSISGKLANEYCPEGSVISRVMIKTDPPFIPTGGLVPNDFSYRVPLETCTLHDASTPVIVPDEDLEDDEDKDENSSTNGSDSLDPLDRDETELPSNGNSGSNGNGSNGNGNSTSNGESSSSQPANGSVNNNND